MYIVFEGPDGAGKTTMASWLEKDIKRYSMGYKTHVFHQPGSTALGERIRTVIKEKDIKAVGYAQFYLMIADHSQFVEECLYPIYFGDQGPDKHVILQDRHSAISGYAFQLYVNKLDQFSYDVNYGANRFKPYQPDAIVMLNVPLDECLRRLSRREPVPGNDRFENAEVLAKVIAGYKDVPRYGIFPEELYHQVNGGLGKPEVYKSVVNSLYNSPRIKGTFMHAILEKILENIH